MYFITPDSADLTSALEGWSWIGLEGKEAVRVTAFADVFLKDTEGIWFLDTLNGKLRRVCSSLSELDTLLTSDEGKDEYLLAGFVERAVEDGHVLAPGECYDFKINPALGGAFTYENIQKQDFVVALHIAGQIHQQIRDLPPGTRISEIKVLEQSPKKPWWRVW